jgi:predicted DCC family thiol-disulfide oxidoreductase YuxK
MRQLTVLYDSGCPFCLRCKAWLSAQRTLVPIELIPRSSREAARRFPGCASEGDELVVVSDEGDVYRGPNAFLMCLWALEDYRAWSLRLAAPTMRPLARRAMEWISHNRAGFSRWLSKQDDQRVTEILSSGPPAGACATGGCGRET